MFTIKEAEELRAGESHYDFYEDEGAGLDPKYHKIAKIQKTATIFTFANLEKFLRDIEKDATQNIQVAKELQKRLQEQEDRLKPYSEEFGVELGEVLSKDREALNVIADKVTVDNLEKLIEANDIVRYIAGIRNKILGLNETLQALNIEKTRYEDELKAIDAKLHITALSDAIQSKF